MAVSSIDPKAYEPDGAVALRSTRGLRVTNDFPLTSIRRVLIANGPGREIRFGVEDENGKRTFFGLPGSEAKDLVEALRARFGERCDCYFDPARFQPTPRRPPPAWNSAALIAAGLAVIGGVAVVISQFLNTPSAEHMPWAIFSIVAVMGLLTAALGGRQLAQIRHRRRVVSAKEPWRSGLLGWLLKIAGFTVFLAAVYLPPQIFFRLLLGGSFPGWAQEFERSILLDPSQLAMSQSLLFGILGASIVQVGHRLGLRAGGRVLAKDRRAPILYLRAFDDDGKHDLNPGGFLSYALGLRTFGSLLRALGPVGNLYPPRMLRLLFGSAADTSEEQIAGYFRRFGPVVAIGRPGEGLSTSGAARLYVDDAAWQQHVLDLLHRAQVVILQPAHTQGVWWEIEACVRCVQPTQLLLCLTSVAASGQAYDEFRRRFAALTGRELPRTPGGVHFVAFDEDWTPRFIAGQRRSELFWPLTGVALDFRRMFTPFLAPLYSERFPSASSSRPRSRPVAWLNASLALLLYGVGLVVLGEIVSLYLSARMEIDDLDHGTRQVVEAGSPPYRLELSWRWRQQDLRAGQTGFIARTPSGFELRVNAEEGHESSAKALVKSFVNRFPDPAQWRVMGQREFEREGRRWLETVVENGPAEENPLVCCHQASVGLDGSFQIMVCWRRQTAWFLPDAGPTLRRVLDGFHLPEPTAEVRAVQAADAEAALAETNVRNYPVNPPGASLTLPFGWMLAFVDRSDTFQFGPDRRLFLMVRSAAEIQYNMEAAEAPSEGWEESERDGRRYRRLRWNPAMDDGKVWCRMDAYSGLDGKYRVLGQVEREEPGIDAKRIALIERAMDSFRLPSLSPTQLAVHAGDPDAALAATETTRYPARLPGGQPEPASGMDAVGQR